MRGVLLPSCSRWLLDLCSFALCLLWELCRFAWRTCELLPGWLCLGLGVCGCGGGNSDFKAS